MTLVTSSVAHAEILSIDTTDALSSTGVVDFISTSDVPGSNIYSFNKDELVFADNKVIHSLLVIIVLLICMYVCHYRLVRSGALCSRVTRRE